jgi:hypothetical protein
MLLMKLINHLELSDNYHYLLKYLLDLYSFFIIIQYATPIKLSLYLLPRLYC